MLMRIFFFSWDKHFPIRDKHFQGHCIDYSILRLLNPPQSTVYTQLTSKNKGKIIETINVDKDYDEKQCCKVVKHPTLNNKKQ